MKKSSTYKSRPHILDQLFRLRQGQGEPKNGSFIQIQYKSFGEPKADALKEAEAAKKLGVPLSTYTGYVERVWTAKNGDLILTMLVFERLREGKYTYRAFNLMKGSLQSLTVITP